MVDSKEKTLSVIEAKAQVRQRAEAASLSSYLQRHPVQVLGLAAGAGLLLANKGVAKVLLRSGSLWWLAGAVLKTVVENSTRPTDATKARQHSRFNTSFGEDENAK